MTSLSINQTDFDNIRSYIERQCGISIGNDKKYLVETRLARLVTEHGCHSFCDFYKKVIGSRKSALRDQIVDAMTTNETLWFRDSSPWVALKEAILPELDKRAAPASKPFRIWSAASSTGQEPYSIAMLIDDYCLSSRNRNLSPRSFEIIASDISESALLIAKSGRYDRISMSRGLVGPWGHFRQRYFIEEGATAQITPEVKSRVQFRKFNLQDSFAGMGKFHIVFLRNVAIYFSDSFKRALFEKVAGVLDPGGYFFLGSAETVSGYSNSYELLEHGRATFYRVRA